MNTTSRRQRSPHKMPRPAIVSSLIAFFIAAAVVSWATPDGNLVVTLVPALAFGLVTFALVSSVLRRRARPNNSLERTRDR